MGGWLVGKSDFNENPVVSPDLDFDLGFVNINDSAMLEGRVSEFF